MKAKKMRVEKSNSSTARNLSIAFHIVLIALALLPFMQTEVLTEAEYNPIVEIVFSNTDISSGKASTAPVKTITKVKSILDKPEIQTKSKPVAPASAPILESTKSPIKIETTPEAVDIKVESVEIIEADENEDVIVEETSDPISSNDSSDDSSSETDGEGDEGEHLDGKTLGDMDFGGEGVFGRKVIYRANVAGIAERNGKVVVNLCINRGGIVSHVAINKEMSTIEDFKYIRKALNVATDYKFESDLTAPKTQCGKLTFIFELK